jgi:RNA polymerase sigma-70 factor, ECF subfamily
MSERRQAPLRLCHPRAALESRDDDELMQLASAGAEGAFETLIRRHQAALRSFCARMCGPGVGDEVAQEVLVALWDMRARYQPRGTFRAFLFTIARRRCQNERRAVSRSSYELDDGVREVDPEQLDALLARERRRQLEARLTMLSSEQREAILLHFAADLDYAEIAEVARRPVTTIRTRVFLGLRRLRALARTKRELP